MDELYKVYVKTNGNSYITAVNSSEFLTDTTEWVEIDAGYGDKYHHAQGNYFPVPIFTEGGAYQYKLVDVVAVDGKVVSGKAVECTPEEIAEQEAANRPEEPVPSDDSVWDELDAAYQEGVDSV